MSGIQWEILLLLVGAIVFAIRTEFKARRNRSEIESKAEKLDLQAREYFQTQFANVNDENRRQASEISDLKERVTELKYELAEKQGEVAALKTELGSLKQSHEALKIELKQYQIENGQLISENAKLTKDNSTVRQQKERAEQLNKQYLQQIADQSYKIEQLETRIQELDMRLRHNEGTIARQAEIIERLQNGKFDTQELKTVENDDLKTPVVDSTPPVEHDDKKDVA